MLKAHKRKSRRTSAGGGSGRSISPRPSLLRAPQPGTEKEPSRRASTTPSSPIVAAGGDPAQRQQQHRSDAGAGPQDWDQRSLPPAPPPQQHGPAPAARGSAPSSGARAGASNGSDTKDKKPAEQRPIEPSMGSVFTEWFQKLFAPNDEAKSGGRGGQGAGASAAAAAANRAMAGGASSASVDPSSGRQVSSSSKVATTLPGCDGGEDVRSNKTSVATSDARQASPSGSPAGAAAAAASSGMTSGQQQQEQHGVSSAGSAAAAAAPAERSAPVTVATEKSSVGDNDGGKDEQQQQQPVLSPRFLGLFSRGGGSGGGKEDGAAAAAAAAAAAPGRGDSAAAAAAAGTPVAAAAGGASTGGPAAGNEALQSATAAPAAAAGVAVAGVPPVVAAAAAASSTSTKPAAAPVEAPSFGGGHQGAAPSSSQQPPAGTSAPPPPPGATATGGMGATAVGAAGAGAEAGASAAVAAAAAAAATAAGDRGDREEAKSGASITREGSGGGSGSRSTSPSRAAALSVGSDDGEEEHLYTAGTHQGARPSIDDFSSLRVLGKGSYGKVVLVRRKSTGVLYAMKILKKGDVVRKRQVERTKIERRVLGNVEHPFLMRLHYAFQTDNKLYLVLDYCPGGELFFHLSRYKRFPEGVVRFYAAELVLALKHLHDNNIIYRDIKPENILLDADGHIKLGDFGLAKDNVSDSTFGAQSVCGTPEYMAPEVINKAGHGTAVDWWGLGMLMYEMLTGLPPWYTKDRQKLFERLRGAPLVIPKNVSAPSASIIGGLLTRNPSKRLGTLGALQVMNHEFFRGLDWAALLAKRIPAPLNPCRNQRQGSESTHNFDPQFTRMPIDTMALGGGIVSPGPDGHFDGFTYEIPGVILEGSAGVGGGGGGGDRGDPGRVVAAAAAAAAVQTLRRICRRAVMDKVGDLGDLGDPFEIFGIVPCERARERDKFG
eukprot:g13162.t1